MMNGTEKKDPYNRVIPCAPGAWEKIASANKRIEKSKEDRLLISYGATQKISDAMRLSREKQELSNLKKELHEKYWRSSHKINLLMKQYDDPMDITEVISLIQKEYCLYGDAWPWEQPTSQYLYEVLSNPEPITEN